MTTRTIRTYRELMSLPTYIERYRYLRLAQIVGETTFADMRWFNQAFYQSRQWKDIRNQVIIRDSACDLAIPDRPIVPPDRVYIHHITPLTLEDLEEMSELVLSPENLICCSYNTHQAIHYGNENLVVPDMVERKPGDTLIWAK